MKPRMEPSYSIGAPGAGQRPCWHDAGMTQDHPDLPVDAASADRAVRRAAGHRESVAANRAWWDAEADAYYAEHGEDLGDAELVWGPEGWTEAELGLLGDVRAMDLLEVGAGAAQGARWCAGQGARVVATDLSARMLAIGRGIDAGRADQPGPTAYLQCDGSRLPFADSSFDVVLTAHGVLAFIPDAAAAIAEWARVLRPGGRCIFSLPHPFRWVFPDAPGPTGLVARHSYFDAAAYVEETEAGSVTYAEHHRTLGDLVRGVSGAGLVLRDLVEPPWPERRTRTWGGWSPHRGRLLPGTAILRADKPT